MGGRKNTYEFRIGVCFKGLNELVEQEDFAIAAKVDSRVPLVIVGCVSVAYIKMAHECDGGYRPVVVLRTAHLYSSTYQKDDSRGLSS